MRAMRQAAVLAAGAVVATTLTGCAPFRPVSCVESYMRCARPLAILAGND